MTRVRKTGSVYLCLAVISLLCVLHGVLHAQPSGDTGNSSPDSMQKSILNDKASIQEEIKKIETLLGRTAEGDEKRVFEEQAELLQKIDLVYEQRLVQVKRSLELSRTLAQLRKEMEEGTGQAGVTEPSYPFSFLDELGDKLTLLQEQTGPLQDVLKTAEESYQSAQEKLKEKAQDLRRIRDEREGGGEALLASPDLMAAELSRRFAQEEAALRKELVENERLENIIQQLKITLLERKIAQVQSRVRFTEEELDGHLAALEDEIAALKTRLEQAKAKKDRAELKWLKSLKQSGADNQPPEAVQEREKEVESLKLWYDTCSLEVMLLSQLITFRNDQKKLWQYRYALFHNTPLVDTTGWRREISQALNQLAQDRQRVIKLQTGSLNEIIVRNEQLASADRGSRMSLLLEEQIRALKEKEGLSRECLEAVQSMQWELKRLRGEIKAREMRIGLRERIANYWSVVYRIWQYELTSIDDRPITVGKIIIALLLFILGFLVSKRLTLQMGQQLVRRFAFDESAAFACQQIVHYLLLILLLLFVLNLVRIPLTFFTVIGGALAIGVGFGSQTIVNNFLSGLILMIERPVKIGDIVEVENVSGTVEWVGARSTRIKTFDNLRLVVPNSTILQNKIINWSLTDDIVRRQITVGVMYGSPVRQVEKLLLEAAGEHKLVEHYPAPLVLFNDFGDSALIFVLHIWVSLARTGKAQTNFGKVESDIRFCIEELFRQEGIVIAYPQRDLHIDSIKPIEVKLRQE